MGDSGNGHSLNIFPRIPLYRNITVGKWTIFLSFVALWVIFVFPALKNAWWGSDDFIIQLTTLSDRQEVYNALFGPLTSSRPLGLLWLSFRMAILYAVHSPLVSGLIIRLAQGCLHAMSATITGFLFVRFTERKVALLTVLPFLLWPYGGEATYWTTGGIYPLAGLLSLFGVLLCLRGGASRWTGMGMIFCSTLINQSGCLLGFIVFWICMMLMLRSPERLRKVRNPLLSILTAYAIGCLVSFAFTLSLHDVRLAAFSPSLSSAIFLLRSSTTLLLSEAGMYPLWLRVLQITIVAVPIPLLIFTTFIHQSRHDACRFSASLILIGAMLFVLPYTPLVLIGMKWLTSRLMYTAPLIFSASFCLFLQLPFRPRVTSVIVTILLAIVLCGYYPLSTTYAQEYVDNFRNDIRTLRALEHLAEESNVSDLVVATYPDRTPTFNPYNLPHAWFGDILISSFNSSWLLKLFAQWSSTTLRLTDDPKLMSSCVLFCSNQQNHSPRNSAIIETSVRFICFCA